jgi:glutamine synthetase
MQQHFTVPALHGALHRGRYLQGRLGFDGSSIRGWQAINESDMLVIPSAETAFIDPFSKEPTLVHDLQHPGSAHQARTIPAIRATSPARP